MGALVLGPYLDKLTTGDLCLFDRCPLEALSLGLLVKRPPVPQSRAGHVTISSGFKICTLRVSQLQSSRTDPSLSPSAPSFPQLTFLETWETGERGALCQSGMAGFHTTGTSICKSPPMPDLRDRASVRCLTFSVHRPQGLD